MLNLFITGNETSWKQSPAFIPRVRCLTEYIMPEYKERYLPLSNENINFLKQIPCIFAYESSCGMDAAVGRLVNISVRQNDIRIDFELTGQRIEHDVFASISQLLDMGTWEMNRTHWTVKNATLEDLQPYFAKENSQPKVFISYSWTPMGNQETVFNLVSRLREDGICVVYDRDDLHPGQNINYFMEQSLENDDIDNIIVICNKDYAEKADNRCGGVGYEAGIIISEIKSAPLQRRVIPVVVEVDEHGQAFMPIKFRELYRIDLTRDGGYEELLKAIRAYKEERMDRGIANLLL